MKLCIFTIVLDGMPFLKWQYDCFTKLRCDWEWIVVEGAAQNNGSTSWCKPQAPRLSVDGTTRFIEDMMRLNNHAITHIVDENWQSKDQMVRFALDKVVDEPCVLMQIDVDELYNPRTLEKIVSIFNEQADVGAIKMFCRYFVGPNLICEGQDCWSNNDYEWLRAWRFEPGMFFEKHEPPVMNNILGRVMERGEALNQHNLTFDHLAYVRREQVEYKEQFYGYEGLTHQWDALQSNAVWPTKLSRFFPFVNVDRPFVRKIG
jgi:hypothetical protein